MFTDDWIPTADLWFWKRPFYQLSHNHFPCSKKCLPGSLVVASCCGSRHHHPVAVVGWHPDSTDCPNLRASGGCLAAVAMVKVPIGYPFLDSCQGRRICFHQGLLAASCYHQSCHHGCHGVPCHQARQVHRVLLCGSLGHFQVRGRVLHAWDLHALVHLS